MDEELKVRIRKAAAALRALGARQVYIFGSAATGTLREGSDIDLAVEGLPPEKFFTAMGRASDILRCPLDLVDLDETNLFTEFLKKRGKLERVE
jgi:predicted nucleotidyltransferase